MLYSKRAATLCVCLVVAFLITHSQGQFVDQVGCSAQLFASHIVAFYLLCIVFSDSIDASFESSGLFVFFAIVLCFEPRVGGQEDVLVGA